MLGRMTGTNAGSPAGREPHGDGVPIVVVRFTPHQGGRESRPQGDMSRATYRHVAGFPDLRVIRPAPTAARPPKPFPGFAGYRSGIASLAPQAIGVETALPGSRRQQLRTFNAQYAEGLLSARSWTKSAFHGLRRACTGYGALSSPPEGGLF